MPRQSDLKELNEALRQLWAPQSQVPPQELQEPVLQQEPEPEQDQQEELPLLPEQSPSQLRKEHLNGGSHPEAKKSGFLKAEEGSDPWYQPKQYRTYVDPDWDAPDPVQLRSELASDWDRPFRSPDDYFDQSER
jgi:hypothetical protein